MGTDIAGCGTYLHMAVVRDRPVLVLLNGREFTGGRPGTSDVDAGRRHDRHHCSQQVASPMRSVNLPRSAIASGQTATPSGPRGFRVDARAR
jgi:hypothetical protein